MYYLAYRTLKSKLIKKISYEKYLNNYFIYGLF